MAGSKLGAKYTTTIDRDSAYERLRARAEKAAHELAQTEAEETRRVEEDREFRNARRYDGGASRSEAAPKRASSSRSDSIGEAFAKSFARQLGSRTGQAVVRGVLGSIFGRK